MINFKKLTIPEIILIEPKIFEDDRGFFFESYNKNDFESAVGRKVNFVQDNHSRSSIGVLRGLHYQSSPYEQGKLVRVISGEVFDVAVDIRPSSNTYGQWVGEYLSSKNKKQLWIPEGFAHGFYTLSECAELVYKTTNFYSADHDRTILWNDNDIDIKWPLKEEPILSIKDQNGLRWKDK